MNSKKARLSNTAAIAAVPADSLTKHESRTTSVRKIENGYLVSESSCKDNQYECREYFSATPPKEATDEEESTMKKAVDYMKRNGEL